ncbi:MAG: DUF2147 domain-containing protein [Bacteroidetes bacterium]|nr:DUF2147 domain-containing protein [Bacteroidota bacterium]
MKNLSVLLLLFIASSFLSFNIISNSSENEIVDLWWNQEKTSKIKIFLAQNGKYAGKIEWLKEPLDKDGKPKTDNNNPNEKLRNNPRLGLAILKNFVFNKKKNKWEGGTIYDPNNGKTYDAYMYFDGNNDKLQLRGYVLGMPFLGRTSVWERVK